MPTTEELSNPEVCTDLPSDVMQAETSQSVVLQTRVPPPCYDSSFSEDVRSPSPSVAF